MSRSDRLLALFALAAGCSDYGFGGVQDVAGAEHAPVIEVEPAFLDFWDAASGEVVVRTFTARNLGDALLEVDSLALGGGASFTLVDDPAPFDLEPGASRAVDVAFTPLAPASVEGQALVYSSDPERPEVPVDLLGEGRVPWLEITPDPYDFGAAQVGCPLEVVLTLQNIGEEDLHVEALDYAGEGLALAAAPALPLTLAPGAFTDVRVAFDPVSEGPHAGALRATSDDPRGPIEANQSGDGVAGATGEDAFTAGEDQPVDILFAVDQSCSMDDDSARLASNFGDFIADVGAVTTGWQVGVVTLDDGCFNHGVLRSDTGDLEALFADAVTLGEDEAITDDEALLQLAERAAGLSAVGACNEGFLRPGSPLHVVVVSDEPERSAEQAAAWTWDHWVEALAALAPAPELLTISGVVDVGGCGEGDAGYAEAIDATGGERLDLCEEDWSAHVAALAAASLEALSVFELSDTPAEGSVTVEVDGAAVETGWAYEAALNAVIFDAPVSGGSSVVVRYALLTDCP